VEIPFAVPLNLGFPKRSVLLRDVPACVAPVPEATVNEYGQPFFLEVEIGRSFDFSNICLPPRDASSYESGPEAGFGGSVSFAANSLHYAAVLGLDTRKSATR
jgi:hypothetical protein